MSINYKRTFVGYAFLNRPVMSMMQRQFCLPVCRKTLILRMFILLVLELGGIMAQGKQANNITRAQERAILEHLKTTRQPARDRAIFLLSVKAGLRAKEIAGLTWEMVTDATGEIADAIALPDKASKGK